MPWYWEKSALIPIKTCQVAAGHLYDKKITTTTLNVDNPILAAAVLQSVRLGMK